MKTIEIVGYKRDGLGKGDSKRLRENGDVPCVLYGGEENVHFYAPMMLFRDLVYTPNVHFVELNVEGKLYKAILQDLQVHPVSEVLLHIDFLELDETKEIKMEIPVKFSGSAPGILKGGKLVTKLRKLKVRSLPQHMPEFIEVSINGLELGKSVKVSSLKAEDYTILNNEMVTIGTIEIPRALKSAQTKAGDAEGEE